MCLGRIIRLTGGEHLSLIPPSYLAILFVAGDVLGLLVQGKLTPVLNCCLFDRRREPGSCLKNRETDKRALAAPETAPRLSALKEVLPKYSTNLLVKGAGAVIMPLGTLNDYYIGSDIVIAGLALLVTSFALFVLVALTFDYRIRRHPTVRSLQTSLNWNADLRTLYISSALIFTRSVFRLVEYSQGNKGWLITREWTLYVFDATLMWLVLIIFNIWHPSHVEAFLKGGKYCEKGVRIVETKMEELACGRSPDLLPEVLASK